MKIVSCYYCGYPVVWDPKNILEEEGITLEDCERNNLAVICNLCLGMCEVEFEVETIRTAAELRSHFKVDNRCQM